MSGSLWVLIELNGEALIAGTTITAEFDREGLLKGVAGCNQYNMQYDITGNSIEFFSPESSTMLACPPELMNQERDYLDALGATKTFSMSDDQLTLFDQDGTLVAVFKKQF